MSGAVESEGSSDDDDFEHVSLPGGGSGDPGGGGDGDGDGDGGAVAEAGTSNASPTIVVIAVVDSVPQQKQQEEAAAATTTLNARSRSRRDDDDDDDDDVSSLASSSAATTTTSFSMAGKMKSSHITTTDTASSSCSKVQDPNGKHKADSDDDSWSHVSDTSFYYQQQAKAKSLLAPDYPASSSSAAAKDDGSTISGFDVLSLGGGCTGSASSSSSSSFQLRRTCTRCSFLNDGEEDGTDDGVCAACGFALVANPCLEADEQIARHLQLQEERLALEALLLRERKRKTLSEETGLVRAQALVNDVAAVVANINADGFATLPEASLVVLASRFIDEMDIAAAAAAASTTMTGVSNVSLAYHFSSKGEGRMTQIRQDGFGPGATIASNLEVAYTCPSRITRRFRMTTIPEDDEEWGRDLVGWIVATVKEGAANYPCFSSRNMRVRSGSADLQTLVRSAAALPLVCFDASRRNSDAIRRLRNGLSQVCFDFFQPGETLLDQHEIESVISAESSSSSHKKHKVVVDEDPSVIETFGRVTLEADGTGSHISPITRNLNDEEPSVLETFGRVTLEDANNNNDDDDDHHDIKSATTTWRMNRTGLGTVNDDEGSGDKDEENDDGPYDGWDEEAKELLEGPLLSDNEDTSGPEQIPDSV